MRYGHGASEKAGRKFICLPVSFSRYLFILHTYFYIHYGTWKAGA